MQAGGKKKPKSTKKKRGGGGTEKRGEERRRKERRREEKKRASRQAGKQANREIGMYVQYSTVKKGKLMEKTANHPASEQAPCTVQ